MKHLYMFYCRRTGEFRKQAACDRNGGPAGSRQDLHLEEVVQIPELDRHKHEGVQPGRVQAARNHRLPMPWIFPSW